MGPIQTHSLNILRGAGLFCGQATAAFACAYITKLAIEALSSTYPQLANWKRTITVITSAVLCTTMFPYLNAAAVVAVFTGLLFFFIATAPRYPSPFEVRQNGYLNSAPIADFIRQNVVAQNPKRITQFIQSLFELSRVQALLLKEQLELLHWLQKKIIVQICLTPLSYRILNDLFADKILKPTGFMNIFPFFEEGKFKIVFIKSDERRYNVLDIIQDPSLNAQRLNENAFIINLEAFPSFGENIDALFDRVQIPRSLLNPT